MMTVICCETPSRKRQSTSGKILLATLVSFIAAVVGPSVVVIYDPKILPSLTFGIPFLIAANRALLRSTDWRFVLFVAFGRVYMKARQICLNRYEFNCLIQS